MNEPLRNGCETHLAHPLPLPHAQCVANHINPFLFLPGFEDRPAPTCPHCKEVLTAEFTAQERSRRTDMTPAQLKDDDNDHKRTHAQGLKHRRPVIPSDNRNRSRGLLHRRMNIVSNCIAATLLRVKFDAKKRIAANALMDKKLIWKMPETAGKRAKTISAGNDARKLLSDPDLLEGLLAIFYEGQAVDATREDIDNLRNAAAANEAVRTEDGAANAAPANGKAPAPANGKAPARANPIAPKAAGVTKPDGDHEDDSLCADAEDEEEDGEMELEEDETAGNLLTAIEVWATAIQYTKDLHTPYADHFDLDPEDSRRREGRREKDREVHAEDDHRQSRRGAGRPDTAPGGDRTDLSGRRS
mmetsp:Transcript_6816/g.15988  ORF Transcript_6816/g.15988 Transcript_6816/m.15988 type:complete len:359 (-) Transcript_6816:81-1157(-)